MKALGVVFAVIGIVTVIGALFLMYSLFAIGAAIGALPPVEGVDTEAFASSLSALLTVGWAWSVAALLAGLIAVRAGWREK